MTDVPRVAPCRPRKNKKKDAARDAFSGGLTTGKTSVISLEVDWHGAIREVRDEKG